MSGRNSFNTIEVVKKYSGEDHLQAPERTFLEKYGKDLAGMNMLDLGVGGGRTTHHFAPLVNSYQGIDNAENMITACKNRFRNSGENIRFCVGDVRHMPELENDSFDLILFSFNGLDYINHEDRLKALREIRRVGKENGLFLFSSHNLNYLKRLYGVQWNKGFKEFLFQLYRAVFVRIYNGLAYKYKDQAFATIYDGYQAFKTSTYYIRPSEQLKQLSKAGFREIQIFSVKTGKELSASNAEMLDEAWLYYLCHM